MTMVIYTENRYVLNFKFYVSNARPSQEIEESDPKLEIETLQWQPMKTILDKRELLLMFKIIKGKAPNYLTMLFSNCNNINYQLRSNNLKISLPKPKTDFLKKSFAYRGAASWNKLPSDILREIDECQSSYSFRILLNKLFHS